MLINRRERNYIISVSDVSTVRSKQINKRNNFQLKNSNLNVCNDIIIFYQCQFKRKWLVIQLLEIKQPEIP